MAKVDTSAPSAPSTSFSALTNAVASGQTVYFRSGAAGGFTVTAASSDAQSGIGSYAFPALGTGWSGTPSGDSTDYSFGSSAADPVEPLNVTAQNNAGLDSSPASFTVSADGAAPVSSIACDGAACIGRLVHEHGLGHALGKRRRRSRPPGDPLHDRRLRSEPDQRHDLRGRLRRLGDDDSQVPRLRPARKRRGRRLAARPGRQLRPGGPRALIRLFPERRPHGRSRLVSAERSRAASSPSPRARATASPGSPATPSRLLRRAGRARSAGQPPPTTIPAHRPTQRSRTTSPPRTTRASPRRRRASRPIRTAARRRARSPATAPPARAAGTRARSRSRSRRAMRPRACRRSATRPTAPIRPRATAPSTRAPSTFRPRRRFATEPMTGSATRKRSASSSSGSTRARPPRRRSLSARARRARSSTSRERRSSTTRRAATPAASRSMRRRATRARASTASASPRSPG